MNLAIKRGLLILSVTSAMVTTFSSTVIAATATSEQNKKYYCKGNYGDDSNQGLWDKFFTASSKQDTEAQAKELYKLNSPGAFVNIREYTLEN
ncbi:MAG TPA: hypothetical protein ACHBX0_03485 [Arsenophonus sp.]